MLEIRSALSTHRTPGKFGALEKSGAVILSEQPLGTLVQLAGWDTFSTDVTSLLAKLGFESPGTYKVVQKARNVSCFRIAPDRLLLRGTQADSLPLKLKGSSILCLDLSHARTVIRLQGTAVEKLLARLSPVDFSEGALAAGSFVQCGIHHVGVLIERLNSHCFDIFVPVTWVATIWDLITDSAAPFGYKVD